MAGHTTPIAAEHALAAYIVDPPSRQLSSPKSHILETLVLRYNEVPVRAMVIVVLLIIGSIYTLWTSLPVKQRYADAPIACVDPKDLKKTLRTARLRFRTDAVTMLQQGYQTFKGRPWYVPSPLGERLMLPSRYIEELKTAPVDEVDFVATFFEMFEGRYTTMGSRSTLHPRTAKQDLNHYMAKVLKPVKDEIGEVFDLNIPATDDWHPINAHHAMVQIVARVSSRMFGGTDLSRNQPWVDATINFALDGFMGAQAIKQYPEIIRPLVAMFIPALGKIKEHHATAQRVIVPILRARRAAAAAGWPDTDGEAPVDFLQWMVENAEGEEKEDSFLAQIQLKLSFAAIHTSAAAPTQLLYDLCAMPEYVEPLLAEIRDVRREFCEYGFDKRSLMKLEKLDSMMKESQRFNPLLLVTFERFIHRPYTFSDGFRIPGNTQIGVPTQAISMDPAFYEEPTRFDGFRFSKLRGSIEARGGPKTSNSNNNAAELGKLAYSSSTHESMAFGYGRHACPGRWFASNEIKMIMVHLLENYEFRLPGGKTGLENRPPSLNFETQYLPNMDAVVEFRRRRT
ncbi:cytochrome P450 [Astrocystis sublimbata]|nr:cytochrome P450 [Astrocystis sublimbata]